MGWCSGTPIFDKVVKVVLEVDASEEVKYQVLLTLADAMEDEDWDCQPDSVYWGNPLVRKVFKELHPTWWNEDED